MEDESDKISWPRAVVVAIFFLSGLAIAYNRPSLIAPFGFFEFWKVRGSVVEAVENAWPWYVYGSVGAIVYSYFGLKVSPAVNGEASEIFIRGFWASLVLGSFDSIVRWLLFLFSLVMLPIFNWICGGFCGLEVIRWTHEYLLLPFANFLTLGYLENYLLGDYGWAVGAATIVSCIPPIKSKKPYYVLLPVIVSSWFFSMYHYWVIFNYGLVASMGIMCTFLVVGFSTSALVLPVQRALCSVK